jgi:hypothetical protein
MNSRLFHHTISSSIESLKSYNEAIDYLSILYSSRGTVKVAPPVDFINYGISGIKENIIFVPPQITKEDYLADRTPEGIENSIERIKECRELLALANTYTTSLLTLVSQAKGTSITSGFTNKDYTPTTLLTTEGIDLLFSYFTTNAMKNLPIFKGVNPSFTTPYPEQHQVDFEKQFSLVMTMELIL